jgi:ATP-dependent DNA helicase RecQ
LNERIAQFRHEELSTFGIGSELSAKQWGAIVRQLLAAGLIDVAGEYGSLRLERGEPARVARRTIRVAARSRQRKRREPASRRAAGTTAHGDACSNACANGARRLARAAGLPPT